MKSNLRRAAMMAAVGCALLLFLFGFDGHHRALAQNDTPAGHATPMVGPHAVEYAGPDGHVMSAVTPEGSFPSVASPNNEYDWYGYQMMGWPEEWIDAQNGGAEVGWTGPQETAVGPLPLPFPFKFYEHTYTQFWVASGYVAFQPASRWNDQPKIPTAGAPNAIVAPYASPLGPELPDTQHHIYYKSGGSAPNRYLVVEWYKVQQAYNGIVSDFTYEVVLYENGNIMFQYLDMNYQGYVRYCAATGIEDSAGLDGINVADNQCSEIWSNHGIMFLRPPLSARSRFEPSITGGFIQASSESVFELTVRNIGEGATDTYNLRSVLQPLPVAFYDAAGAPLADTDGDYFADTGPLAQGAGRTVVVGLRGPAFLNVGDEQETSLIAPHASGWIATGFAAPFAQAYADDRANQGDVQMAFVEPGFSRNRRTVKDGSFAYEVATAEAPGGGVVEIWNQEVAGAANLFGAIYDIAGNQVSPPRQLTFSPGIVNGGVWHDSLAIASTADGHIGVLWTLWRANDEGGQNVNIEFMVLDRNGVPVYGPVELTHNERWRRCCVKGWLAYYTPKLVATPDNHFIAAWVREDMRDGNWHDNIDYEVLDSTGGILRNITTYSTANSPDLADSPALIPLTDGRVLLLYNGEDGLSRAVLDTFGGVVQGEVLMARTRVSQPDGVQLSGGRVFAAALYYDSVRGVNRLKFIILDGTSFNFVAGPFALDYCARSGDFAPSVTIDQNNHGIVTWTEAEPTMRGRICYALVDDVGKILTGGVPFMKAESSDLGPPAVRISANGYGNAPYRKVTPTTDGIAPYVKTGSIAVGAPGGGAPIFIEVGNLGREPLVNATLIVTMTSALTLVSASPYPESVMLGAPAGASDDAAEITQLMWKLPPINFQGVGRFGLNVQIPDVEIGKRYFVGVTLDTMDDPNNSAVVTSLRVMAAEQLHLPEVWK